MYTVKSRVFLDLSKTQKSALCNHLRSLVKNLFSADEIEVSCEFVLQKFLEDERYYLDINASRFPYLESMIHEVIFSQDCRLFINACIKYYEYKKSQEPIFKAQKEFEKKKRKFLQEVKMSKEPATKKQLSYYKNLCKRYNLEQKNETELSKLDLRNEIDRILNEHKTN